LNTGLYAFLKREKPSFDPGNYLAVLAMESNRRSMKRKERREKRLSDFEAN